MTIATRTDSVEENDGGGNQAPTPQPGMSSAKDTSPGGTVHQGEGGGGGSSCSPNCTCKFPVEKLAILDSKISSSRWVVPVLPEQELECLIKAAIELCKTNSDVESEPCQRFYREGLTVSFTKILTDDVVRNWKSNIHNCIYNNCQKLVELVVLKLGQDVIPLLDVLTMVFNPCNTFHTFNSNQQSVSVPVNSNIPDEEVFARPVDYYKNQRGWLVDLINLFGNMGGFQALLERFQNKSTLTIPLIFALIRPFGQVHEYLTLPTILKYFMPILEIIPEILDNLTDDELKREAKNESKNDAIAVVIKSCKLLAARVPHQEETVKQLEIFRLKIILRLLQISSFNGKMNALNEVNKVIAGVAYYPHRHPEEEWLTPDRMAKWIKDNNVLEILLRDSLHQPQYVEKLEKILRFLIKEKCLSLGDLDAVWAAQSGKHDAIVKNVHELLAKLAWDFSPVQLDHLFVCFQASWSSANRKQTEKLLELIRRLAEDDKDGVMADKVLNLFWSLAHSDDVMTDIMEQALASHLKILDYSCSQERDKQKTIWLQTCIDEFKSNPKWVVPALRQIKDIVCLYEPGGSSHAGGPTPGRANSANNRQSIIAILIKSHSLITLVTNNLCAYMSQVRDLVRENPDINPEQYYPDGRYNHVTQVQERLSILRFLIKDGQVWLCETQARQIWTALAQEAIFHCDREACFKWFSKLMTDSDPDLDPKMMKDFFEKHILHFEPAQLTESGLKCFEKFFKSVNIVEGKLLHKVKKRSLLLNNADLTGSEYLWRVITNAGEDIAFRAIELLKEVSTHLGPQLQSSLTQYHKTFIGECLDRLRAHYDTIGVLTKQNIGGADEEPMIQHRLNTECIRMCRVLKVLHEYITECDNMYSGERKLIPLHRACRGKHLLLSVRFNQPGGRSLDDIELPTHTHDTIGSVRRALLRKIKPVLTANMKLDLYLNGDFLDTSEDRKLLSSLTHQNKLFLTGKLSPSSSSSSHHLTSSPESNNSDSSASPSPPPPPLPSLSGSSSMMGGAIKQEATPPSVVEAESSLPGVLMSQNAVYTQFLFQIGDKAASLRDAELRDSARCILRSIPADTTTVHRIKTAFTKTPSSSQVLGGAHITSPVNEIFYSPSPSQVLYNLEVMYAMLMPAVDTLSDKSLEFQHSFLSSEHVVTVVDILTKTNFLCNTDLATKRSAYLIVLKIVKFLLTILGHIKISLLEFSRLEEDSDSARISELESGIVLLKQAFHQSLPACTNEFIVRNIGVKLSQVFVTSHLYCPLSTPCHNSNSNTSNNSHSNNNSSSTTSLSPLVGLHAPLVAMDTETNTDFANDCDNNKGLAPTDNTTNVFQVLTSNRFNTLLTSNRQQSSLDSVTPSELFNMDTSSVVSPSQHSTTHSLSSSIALSIAPNLDTVQALLKIIWAASRGNFETKSSDLDSFTRRTRDLFDLSNACDTVNEEHSLRHVTHLEPNQTKTKEIDYDDVLVCKEALELFTVCLLLNNTLLKELLKETYFAHFLVETLLVCDEKIVRACVQEQMTLSITLAYAYNIPSEQAALVTFLQLLLPLLQSPALENRLYAKSGEYFSLFCKILNFVSSSLLYVAPSSLFSASVDVEKHLTQELSVLKRLAQGVKKSGLSSTGGPVVSETAGQREVLLQGHLSIVHELVCFLPSERKTEFGVTNGLVRDLINDYLFPTSKLMLKLEKTGEILFNEIAPPVCQTPDSISAGFSLLIGLCTGSVPNLKLLVGMLTDMFYPDYAEPLTEWDFLPPIGPKPSQGFVGLKNAGATCYMNSVLQQLFMVDQIRIGILGAEGSIQDDFEDISSDESDNMTDLELSGESRREYNIEILKQIQIIFGYLEFSQLQYYIPKGLWRHFKLQGEPVNVREQQDAVEFFMNLIESLDEALKSLNQDQIMAHTLGGLYSDQKICQECPHRYSKEEPFSVISVDIRNHCSLLDSLEQYVKGELLEGADAYMCDKCDKKVVTVKRLCVKKLPPILGIQLKRFEYDFERLCAIKFNDYFEFPRNLDMEPYTVKGLAKIEGEMIEDEIETEHGGPGGECTKYKLTGIVVHSGQASGGHYYSYILHRGPNNQCKWYKFDDGDVSECKMDDEDEMKAQCFGGDYVGEIYDHMLKRVSVRKQKRWWNAYMLFYTRHDVLEQRDKTSLLSTGMQNLTLDQSSLKLPLAIERSVWRQNIKFIHDRNQFSVEYFNFIKQLAMCNIGPAQSHNSDKMTQGSEALSLITVQLVSKFLFSIGFHTKKSLRGLASDWFECLSCHFRCYRTVRCWFAYHILFKHPHRFCEYLLASPIPEVRSVFMKILVYLAHFSLGDDLPSHLLVPPPALSLSLAPEPMKPSMSDMLLLYVLSLCNKELSEYGKHCPHYFTLFQMYASMGRREKAQLLKLNVPTLFILIALDEGPGPPIKYQCPELSKLHSVVLLLVRCCDVTFKCMSVCPGSPVLRNPYLEDLEEGQQQAGYLQPLDVNTSDLLFNRNHYIKKLIEDSQISEDCLKFLQFLSWENPQMSKTVISDLLQQIAFAYCHELRHFFDLLLGLLIMQDSWQTQRILLAMKGIDDERDGLFDTIQKSKSHYQKRAYQCIKCLVGLFSKCPLAYDILLKEDDLKKKWILAAHWLRKELERRPSAQYTQYSYSNWSPPAIQSNETANGYFLERSNSAKKVLEAAFVLCPSEEVSTERGGVGGGVGVGGVDTSDVSSDEEADEDSTGGEDMDTSETWTSPSHPGGGGPGTGGENWDKTGRYIPLKWGSSSQGTSVGTGGGGGARRTTSSTSKLGKSMMKKVVSVPAVTTTTTSSVKSTSSFLDKLYQYDRDLPPPASTPSSPSTSSLPPSLKPGGGGGSGSPLLPYEIETNTLVTTHTEGVPYQVEGDTSYEPTNSPTVTPFGSEPMDPPSGVSLPHTSSSVPSDLSDDSLPHTTGGLGTSTDVRLPRDSLTAGIQSVHSTTVVPGTTTGSTTIVPGTTTLHDNTITLDDTTTLPGTTTLHGTSSLPGGSTTVDSLPPPPPPLVDNVHPSSPAHPQSLPIPDSPPYPPSSSSSSPSS
uniref:ubiquitinyl hydrolase 1 n=1 Tax=Cacopsylla melanoneura TaxID=428564 RepID=A0A8D8QPH5_9HEMI